MLPGRLVSCVARVSTHAADMEVSTEAPTRLTAGAWTEPSLLDDAAERLAAEPVEVYWLRVDQLRGSDWMAEEVAMVARLVRRAGIPVVASCTSAVFAMQVLTVPRIALVTPAELNPTCGSSRVDANPLIVRRRSPVSGTGRRPLFRCLANDDRRRLASSERRHRIN